MSSKTKIQQAFMHLLQAGLWGKQDMETPIFPLTEKEWKCLFEMARKQTVEGIIIDGLQGLAEEQLPPTHIRMRCMLLMHKIEQHNQRQIQLIGEQLSFFNRQDIHPILLKGQGVAVCYRHPLHRMSGDVDWYFEQAEHYAAAQLSLSKMGAAVATVNGQQVYQWNRCEMDLQNRLFDVYNPFSFKFLRRTKMRYPDVIIMVGEQPVTVLAPIMQVIQVSTHILKHSLAFGIGFRQFCDLACLYHQYAQEIDGVQLREIYRKIGLLNWIERVHQLLVEKLGLEATCLPFPPVRMMSVAPMLDDIFASGNFGFYDRDYTESSNGQFVRRKDRAKQLFRRLWKHVPLAPAEAFWFPFAHLLTKNND